MALVAWGGLVVQFEASWRLTGSALSAAWVMLRYFTVLANLVLAAVFSIIALVGRPSPRLLGGAVIAIVLVGIVYGVLLRGLVELSGGALLADTLLHKVTPVLALVYWVVFAPKAGLRAGDPLVWALFPLGYFIYALVRGRCEGIYAYPFIDVAHLGWARVTVNGLAIAAGFLLAGSGLVLVGRVLDRS